MTTRNINVPAGTTSVTITVGEALPAKPVTSTDKMIVLGNTTISERRLKAMGPCVKFPKVGGGMSRNRSTVWAVSEDGKRIKVCVYRNKYRWKAAAQCQFVG